MTNVFFDVKVTTLFTITPSNTLTCDVKWSLTSKCARYSLRETGLHRVHIVVFVSFVQLRIHSHSLYPYDFLAVLRFRWCPWRTWVHKHGRLLPSRDKPGKSRLFEGKCALTWTVREQSICILYCLISEISSGPPYARPNTENVSCEYIINCTSYVRD